MPPVVVDTPQILQPEMGQAVNFNEPITIRWDWNPMNVPVTQFHLCIGTARGDWNILDGEVGLFDRFSFVPPPLPAEVNQIHIQLVYRMMVTDHHPLDQEALSHTHEETFLAGRIAIERA